jgi:hypothetical protein
MKGLRSVYFKVVCALITISTMVMVAGAPEGWP